MRVLGGIIKIYHLYVCLEAISCSSMRLNKSEVLLGPCRDT